MDVIHIAALVE